MPTREELKAVVHEYLVSKANSDRVGQLNDLLNMFQKVVKRVPNEAEQRIMLEAAHEAMLAGVVIFGRDLGQGFPWLWITDFGLRALKESKFPPYDPDGFIAEVKNAVAGMDAVCLQYLAEAVHAYAKGLPLSAAVM